MTDDLRPELRAELDALAPGDANLAARLRDFGDHAVRPFDAASIAAFAVAASPAGRGGFRVSPRVPAAPPRAAWIVLLIALVIIVATIGVVIGSVQMRPSLVQVPSFSSTAVPSRLAVGPSESAGPLPSPREPGPAVLGPGRITYTIDGDVYVADIDGSGAKKILSGGTSQYRDPRWAADGRISVARDASDTQDAALDIDLTDSSGVRPSTVGHVITGQGNTYHRWSPDGTRLAILDRGSITVVGGDAPVTLSPPAGEHWDVSDVVTFDWSPDGSALLAGACQPEGGFCPKASIMRLMLVPTDGRAPRELAPASPATWAASFSPDGSHIAFVDSQADGFELEVMDRDGSNRRVVVPPDATGSWTNDLTYAWSPDGRSIAFHHSIDDGNGEDLTGGKGLWIKDIDSNAPPRLVTPSAGIFDVRAWSPDGRWILAAGFDGDTSILSAIDVVTGDQTVLARGTQDGDWTWDVSPDPTPSSIASRSSGAELVFIQGREVIVSDVDGQGRRTIGDGATPPRGFGEAPDLPPFPALARSFDGRTVAYADRPGIRIVTIDGAGVGAVSKGSTDATARIGMTWAPDDARLAIYRDADPHGLSLVARDGTTLGSIALPSDFRVGMRAPTTFAWSPDGRWIAISGCTSTCPGGPDDVTQDGILLVAADGSGSHWLNDRTVRLDPLPVGGNDAWADWSPDSRLAISRSCDSQDVWCNETDFPALQIKAPDGDAGVQSTTGGGGGPVAWSPDGTRVAVATWTPGGALSIREADGTFTEVPQVTSILSIQALDWAPDARSLLETGAATDGTSTLSLWSIPLTGDAPAHQIATDVASWFGVDASD